MAWGEGGRLLEREVDEDVRRRGDREDDGERDRSVLVLVGPRLAAPDRARADVVPGRPAVARGGDGASRGTPERRWRSA